MEKPHNVFISYAKDDMETAGRLYRDLKKAGVIPWMDTYDLLPGQNWKLAIEKAIKETDYVITLLSSGSVNQRGFRQKEQKIALDILDEMPESKIFLIPVRIDDCQMPSTLDHLLPTDLFPEYETGFGKLLKVFQAGGDAEKKQSSPNRSGKEPPAPSRPSADPDPESFPSDEPDASKSVLDAERTGHKMPAWVLKVSIGSALVFITSLLAIAVFIPHPTTFQIFVFRIVLALAAAAFGATIPGFFKIRMPLPAKGLLHGGGAMGLFILVFMVNPPELIAPAQAPRPILLQKLTGTILDQHGEPLKDVLVSLPEKGKETRTNAQGFFSLEIEGEKQATVRVMAQKAGFVTHREDVVLGLTGKTFKMEKKP